MLWDTLKDLKTNQFKIYIGFMDEDKTPDNYMVIDEYVSDGGLGFGDGKDLLRRQNFNIRIYTRTLNLGLTKSDLVIQTLRNTGINTQRFGPTLDSANKQYATLITGAYNV